jgi:hypothetical protein
MQLLWIILRWLYPTDPVQQCIEAAKHRIALMASEVFSPQSLFLLEHDPQARLYIEALIIDYEAALHMAIGARACQIAKMRFRMHKRTSYTPTRALNVAALLARVRALVAMVNNIERLAQIRAERLKRERDANPLSLRASSPLRLAATPRSTSPSFAGGGPHASSSLSAAGGGGATRSGVTEGAGRNAAGCPRGPPPTIVVDHPQPASHSPARSRPHACLRPHQPSLTCATHLEGLSCV